MNKIIPFTNSIILYFLFPFLFFFISKFSKLKNIFFNFFSKFFCRKLYIAGNFGSRFTPPTYTFPFPKFSIPIHFHFCQNFPRIFIHALNNYSLNICSETNMGSTKSCQFNFLQGGCLRCQHPICYHSMHHQDSNNQDVKYLVANFRTPYLLGIPYYTTHYRELQALFQIFFS